MFWALKHLNACNNGCDLMEFIRVNENLVKCLITEEDMEQYDIKIEDFFSRKESTLEFIHEIMKMAAEEVDFKPNGMLTSLQIAPTSDNGLAIFMTEKADVDPNATLRMLEKAGINMPDDMVKKLEEAPPAEQRDFFKKLIQNIHKEIAKGAGGGEHTTKPQSAKDDDKGVARLSSLERKMFAFDGMQKLFAYARVVERPEEVNSSLYKDEAKGIFYLLIERKDASVQTLAGVYLTAYEYGNFVSEKEDYAEFIKEHCTCIIPEQAISKLKQ